MHWADRIGRRVRLRDVHILLTVVQAGSMARAAQDLAVSQPVVSKAILDLEHALGGVRLLDRSRTGVEPTAYGRALLSRGLAAFDELRLGVEEIAFLSDPTSGEVKIGAAEPMVISILPPVIEQLQREHPKLVVDVQQAASGAAVYQDLRERKVDFVVGRLPQAPLEPEFEVNIAFDDPVSVVAGEHSKWARRKTLALSDLIEELWALPRPDSLPGRIIAAAFEACDLRMPRGAVTSNSTQLLVSLVSSGRYLAILPRSVIAHGTQGRTLNVLPVALRVVARPVAIVTLRDRTLSPAAERVMRHVQDMGAALVGR
jgi:DNA-binding transcriptional LysR family regulator